MEPVQVIAGDPAVDAHSAPRTIWLGCVVFTVCPELLKTVGVLPQVNTSDGVIDPLDPAAVTYRWHSYFHENGAPAAGSRAARRDGGAGVNVLVWRHADNYAGYACARLGFLVSPDTPAINRQVGTLRKKTLPRRARSTWTGGAATRTRSG
jgi:hypothetical protein